MKGLIQRVTQASVAVDDQQISAIGPGLLLLLGVERNDTVKEAKDLCRKILSYRVFPDTQGRMNVNVHPALRIGKNSIGENFSAQILCLFDGVVPLDTQ